jgi:nitrile hydratase accessory protein
MVMSHQHETEHEGERRRPLPAPQGFSAAAERLIAHMEGTAALPRQNGELVFNAPWESRAFGMAVALYEQGRYQRWDEFRERLIAEIAAWERRHREQEEPWNYYERWLAALERLLVEKGLLSQEEIELRTAEVSSGTLDEGHARHAH